MASLASLPPDTYGRMSEPSPLLQAHEPPELAGLGQVADPRVEAGVRPAVALVQALDLPLDVEPPGGLPRPEAQRLERQRDLGHPALVRDARARVPDTVPLEARLRLVVRDLPVGAGARRVHGEEEAVALVEERVEDDRDAVVHVEVRVSGELRRDDRGRRAVATEDPESRGCRHRTRPGPRYPRWRPRPARDRAAPGRRSARRGSTPARRGRRRPVFPPPRRRRPDAGRTHREPSVPRAPGPGWPPPPPARDGCAVRYRARTVQPFMHHQPPRSMPAARSEPSRPRFASTSRPARRRPSRRARRARDRAGSRSR